jgi:hypothetical protein
MLSVSAQQHEIEQAIFAVEIEVRTQHVHAMPYGA